MCLSRVCPGSPVVSFHRNESHWGKKAHSQTHSHDSVDRMSIVAMDVTPPAASPAGPARKTLFRSSSKSGAGVHTRTVPSSSAVPDVYESLLTTVRSDALPIDDGEERMSVAEKQQVDDIMNGLREEVKELERTAWLYESVQEQVRDN